MARIELYTYKDLIDHGREYLGANASAEAARHCRLAALNALADLARGHRWTYYFERWRLATVAPYSTGTVAYDHTGGTYERQLTLTTGTWPSWAALGTVQINSVLYEVAERKSNSVVTLSVNSNPGDDVASTTYSIFRDTYPLPINFLAMGAICLLNRAVLLSQEHPSSWLERQQIYRGPGTPRTYCIRADPNYQNTLAISFFPPPDNVYNVDAIYQRMPRQLKVEEYTAGTVTTSSGSTTVTGSGTAWASRHVGCVLRVLNSTTNTPTGRAGEYPADYERVVVSVESATSLTVDDLIDETLTAKKYVLSDPVDVETQVMLTALQRGVESQLAKTRRMQDRQEVEAEYVRALLKAREADSRSFQDARAGAYLPYPVRLADMPRGSDV